MQKAHAVDEFVDVSGINLQVDRIDIGKALEQRAFSFHYRLRSERTEIAKAQHCGAIRNHRDEIAFGGVIERRAGLALDMQARESDTRRIGKCEIALRR